MLVVTALAIVRLRNLFAVAMLANESTQLASKLAAFRVKQNASVTASSLPPLS